MQDKTKREQWVVIDIKDTPTPVLTFQEAALS